jgi:hypothetical protein
MAIAIKVGPPLTVIGFPGRPVAVVIGVTVPAWLTEAPPGLMVVPPRLRT